MNEPFAVLVQTRLTPPRLRPECVPRSALLTQLEAALDKKLILIAAAAGSGKTTLIAAWCQQHLGAAAWLSLDERDNDPVRFFAYVLAAIQMHHPNIGRDLLAALQSPQPPSLNNSLDSLLNQLATLPQKLILVLDDYHVITNTRLHTALTFLLDHLPPQITLVLLTRADPPLPVARWRVRDELLELRADNLQFSPQETSHFLNHTMQLALSEDAITALAQRTEGWIAGLQLAALALQTYPGDKTVFVHNFTGSHRFILDYLISEVLAQQPQNIRHFLLQTACLRRFSSALCDAVTQTSGGQATLDYLERNHLFLIPLDEARTWYRYHHLFGDLLQARLKVEQPEQIRLLQQRAARWHEQHNQGEDAIFYALAAQDFDHAAALMTGSAANTMQRGEVLTLLNWYQAFPPDFVARHAKLCLQFGMAFALNGRWQEAEILLKNISDTGTLHSGEVLILAFLIASHQQNVTQLQSLLAIAAEQPNPDRITQLALGLLYSVQGNLRQAVHLMAAAQAESERAGDAGLALTALFHQCLLHVFLGNLQQAQALCETALRYIHAADPLIHPMANFAHVSLGRIYIEWHDLDKATYHLQEAIRLAERSGLMTGVVSSATMMLAEVAQARGEPHTASEKIQQAFAYAAKYDPPSESQWLKIYAARVWLRQGNLANAADWLKTADTTLPLSLFYPNTIQRITQARLVLAQRQLDRAVSLLTHITADTADLLTVEAFCALAVARQAQGDSVHALLALEQALRLAEPEKRIQVFLELGTPLAKLLQHYCDSHPEAHFARSLLPLFPTEALPQQVDFSERELAILRLIAAGKSNDEIAQTLTLALSTVKWYINVLYSKLQVKTRAQAIARLHNLKLFRD